MFHILPSHTGLERHHKGRVTCITCQLKKCVGRCRWEFATCPQPPKGKAA